MRALKLWRAFWLIALGILVWTVTAPAHDLGAPVWAAVTFFFAIIFGDGIYRIGKAWRLIKELKR